jgi:hypothetical protein
MLHCSMAKGSLMASKAKPVAEPAPPPRPAAVSFAEMIGDWVRQATEGFIATEKILLDLAAQQNALALTIVRERLGLFSPTPSKAAVDLSGRGVHNFFEAQRLLLDMLARQNTIVADGLKPGLTGTPAEALADVVHRGLDNFILAQKRFMDIFEAEAEGAVKDFGEDKRFDAARLTTLAREGMRNFVASQKQFLEIVEEKLAARAEGTTEAEGEQQHIDLFDMAKQSVDAFVEAQKRLLDLASDQIDVNVKMAREVFSPETDKRTTTTFPDLVKKSVDSFVAAQKALVEVASRPRKTAEREEQHEPEVAGVGA